MSDDVFEHVIGLLSRCGFTGRISLYNNNEPLLDPKLCERAEYVKQHVPTAQLHTSTNTLLLSTYANTLFNGCFDSIDMNVYDKNRWTDVVNILTNNDVQYYVKINREDECASTGNTYLLIPRWDPPKPHKPYTNRGGVLGEIKVYGGFCPYPFVQLNINVRGELTLCCQDALQNTVFDNIMNYDDIDSCWNSVYYKQIRSLMETCGRRVFSVCKYCDVPCGRIMHHYNMD